MNNFEHMFAGLKTTKIPKSVMYYDPQYCFKYFFRIPLKAGYRYWKYRNNQWVAIFFDSVLEEGGSRVRLDLQKTKLFRPPGVLAGCGRIFCLLGWSFKTFQEPTKEIHTNSESTLQLSSEALIFEGYLIRFVASHHLW